MDLANFGILNIETFVLVLARTAGIFTLAPIFGSSRIPAQIRVAISVALALVFVPLAVPKDNVLFAVDVLPLVFLVVKEAIVGLTIGFVVTLVFGAIQAAGDFVDIHAGFSFATVIDPIYGSHTAVAGRFHQMLAGLLFFATNAHHIVMLGLADSFRLLPPGSQLVNQAAASGVFDLFSGLFAIGVKIAAPIIAATFLADISLGILARAVPQLNVLMVGFPLKLGVGLVGMMLALPITLALTKDTLFGVHNQTISLLRLLAGH
jgi:flagellar biosynthetic protein FliR